MLNGTYQVSILGSLLHIHSVYVRIEMCQIRYWHSLPYVLPVHMLNGTYQVSLLGSLPHIHSIYMCVQMCQIRYWHSLYSMPCPSTCSMEHIRSASWNPSTTSIPLLSLYPPCPDFELCTQAQWNIFGQLSTLAPPLFDSGGHKEMSSILADQQRPEPRYRGKGGVAGSKPMSTAVHMEPN